MSDLRDTHAQADSQTRAHARAGQRLPRPRERRDGGLVTLSLTIGAVFAMAGLGLAGWMTASGRFDPPLLAAVDDPRILADYRSHPAPMVDLATSADSLFIAHADGVVTTHDIAGGLFATETIPRQAAGGAALVSPISQIGGGCATLPCADDTLYAVSEDGGLARRAAGMWELLLGDGAFLDHQGHPVPQEALRGWAVSDDGRFVLADAGAAGIGLFDQTSGGWQTAPAIPDATHGPLWQGGAFWIGSPRGLHRLTPQAGDLAQIIALMPDTEGEVLDLAVSAGDGLMVLQRGACSTGGQGCLSLHAAQGRGPLHPLLSEIAANPDLNDASLWHVAMQSGQLVTIGQRGVHRYDPTVRHWQSLAAGLPDTYAVGGQGADITVAFPSQVVVVTGAQMRAEHDLDAPLTQLIAGATGEAFGLDTQGRILHITAQAAHRLTASDDGIPSDARFVSAAVAGSEFIAIGPQGALVHDMAQRRYSFIPADDTTAAAAEAMLVARAAGEYWLVSPVDGRVTLLHIAGDYPDKTLELTPVIAIKSPVRAAHPVGDALDLVMGDGNILRVTATGHITARIGAGLEGDRLRPVSMAGKGDWLVFAAADHLWQYRGDLRAFQGPLMGPQGGAIRDIAVPSAAIFASDANARAWAMGENGWTAVMGGPHAAAADTANITDAVAARGQLYLASTGMIEAYSPAARGFVQQWQGAGGHAEILDVQSAPLWRSDEGVYLGDERILGGAGFTDGWQGARGPVALMAPRGGRYLQTPSGCLFRGAAAPALPLRDVVQIAPDLLLARNQTGAHLYDATLHRWSPVTGLPNSDTSQIRAMNGYLVAYDATTLRAMELTAISRPDSCADSALSLTFPPEITALQVNLADDGQSLLILDAQGGLQRWRGGTLMPLLAPTTAGPAATDILRFHQHGDMLLALTAEALWRYDFAQRQWARTALTGGPTRVVQASLTLAGESVAISLWDADGRLSSTVGDLSAESLALAQAGRPVLPEITAPQDLRDMAQHADRIWVLGRDTLSGYAQGAAAPDVTIALPSADAPWTMTTDSTGGLVLREGPPDAPLAYHRISPEAEGQTSLARVAASYRVGSDTGHGFDGADGLLRIDATLTPWRCKLVYGAAPDCTALAPAPLMLAPADVLGYLPDGELLLTRQGLWRLGAHGQPVARLDSAGITITPDTRLIAQGNDAYLSEGVSAPLWHLPRSDDPRKLIDAVDRLFPYEGTLFAITGIETTAIRDGRVSRPEAAPTDGLRQWTTREGTSVLRADGTAWSTAGPSPEFMTFAPDSRAVLAVPNREGAQWVMVDAMGAAALHAQDNCLVPPDPATLPAPDFIGPPVLIPESFTPCTAITSLGVTLAAHEVPVSLTRAPVGDLLDLVTTAARYRQQADGSMAATPHQSDPAAALMVGTAMGTQIRTIGATSYLNPPQITGHSLHIGRTTESISVTSSRLLPAFDLGWLTWLRGDGGAFEVATSTTPQRFAPEEMIRDGRFLPLLPARGLRQDRATTAWLNAAGLWRQDAGGMTLVSAQVSGLPDAMDDGLFHLGASAIAPEDGSSRPVIAPRMIALHGFTFTTEAATNLTSASVPVSGTPRPAMGARGFLHDDRLDVADAAGGVLLTPLGIVPLTGYGPIFAAPEGTRDLASENTLLHAAVGSTWHTHDPARDLWTAVPPPHRNRPLARESGRIWTLREGAVDITPATPADAWRLTGEGLRFDGDTLLAFAADTDAAVLLTRAGSHIAPDVTGFAAPLDAPLPAPFGAADTRFDAGRADPARSVVYAVSGNDYRLWDKTTRLWRAPATGEDLWAARTAASLGGITLRFAPTPSATIAMTLPDGRQSDVPFTWQRGRFMPFDRALVLHADPQGTEVLIGTDMGLRQLTGRGTQWQSGPLWAAQDPAATVTALGRPANDPATLAVTYRDGTCFTRSGQGWTGCSSAPDLRLRHVIDTPFWHWTKAADSVQGSYLVQNEPPLPIDQPIAGRLPHDTLSDGLSCGPLTLEQWEIGAVLRIADQLHRIAGLESLVCLPTPLTADGGAQVAAGLYALTRTAAFAVTAQGPATMPLPAPETAVLRDAGQGIVIADHGRLRYGLADGLPRNATFGLDQYWHDTLWQHGRIALDQARLLAWRGGLQAVTPAGVVAAPNGRLDTGNLVVMGTASPRDWAACDPQSALALDGRGHGIVAAPGQPLLVGCAGGQTLAGITDGNTDLGTFTLSDLAPPEARLLVSDGPWRITQTQTAATDDPQISFEVHGEVARLTAGRFDFDSWQRVAAPFGTAIDMVTDSGWWRMNPRDLSVAGMSRPPAPLPQRTVTALTRDLSRRDGAVGLCVTTPETAQFWAGGRDLQDVPACRTWRGSDGLWDWFDDNGPMARGLSLEGQEMVRRLEAGRFGDLVVQGIPTALADALYIPTGAGVLRYDASDARITGLHAATAPLALVPLTTGGAALVQGSGALRVGEDPVAVTPEALVCPVIPAIIGTIASGVTVEEVTLTGPQHVVVTVKDATGRSEVLLDCQSALARPWAREIATAAMPRSLAFGDAAPQALRITLDGGLTLESPARSVNGPAMPLPQAMAHAPDGTSVFVLADGVLSRIDTARAIGTVMAGATLQETAGQATPQQAPPAQGISQQGTGP